MAGAVHRDIGHSDTAAVVQLRQMLRWDLSARFVLGIIGPLLLLTGALGARPAVGLTAGLAGGLAALASLGPELRHPQALLTTLLAAPAAVALATAAADRTYAVVAVVFILFAVFGAMTEAGLTARMAWYPVAALGLLAALQPPSLPAWQAGALTLAGAAWAILLAYLVPVILRPPTMAVTPQQVPFGAGLRTIASRGTRGCIYPLLLGAAAAAVVVAATSISGGLPQSAYWAGFALLAVTQPTTLRVRTSAVPTLLGTIAGALLSATLVVSHLPTAAVLAIVLASAACGALTLIWSAFLRTMLFTPLSIVFAALAGNVALVAGIRAADYLLGAAIALIAATLYEALEHRLERTSAAK